MPSESAVPVKSSAGWTHPSAFCCPLRRARPRRAVACGAAPGARRALWPRARTAWERQRVRRLRKGQRVHPEDVVVVVGRRSRRRAAQSPTCAAPCSASASPQTWAAGGRRRSTSPPAGCRPAPPPAAASPARSATASPCAATRRRSAAGAAHRRRPDDQAPGGEERRQLGLAASTLCRAPRWRTTPDADVDVGHDEQ